MTSTLLSEDAHQEDRGRKKEGKGGKRKERERGGDERKESGEGRTPLSLEREKNSTPMQLAKIILDLVASYETLPENKAALFRSSK